MIYLFLKIVKNIFKLVGLDSQIKHLNSSQFSNEDNILNNTHLLGLKLLLSQRKIANPYPTNVLNPVTVELLIKHFGGKHGQQTDLETSNLGFGLFHYSLIRSLKPEKILCVGSEMGFVPAVCALACRDNNKGSVDFVDAGKNSNENNSWGGTGFWKKTNPRDHFKMFGLNKNIDTYIMTSQQYAKKYKKKYDYIYLDGDHSYQGIKHDFEMFWPRLVHNGMMIFHDINLTGLVNSNEYGIWKLWKKLKKKYNTIEIPGFDNSLGIIQKK